jgi:hypothetical protein
MILSENNENKLRNERETWRQRGRPRKARPQRPQQRPQ